MWDKIVVAGNHDWVFVRDPQVARALLGEVHYLQDEGLVLEGVSFWGSPWQPAYHDWAFNLPREQLAAVWRQIPAGLDVLVTHGPPAGIGDRSPLAARRGCQALRERVEQVAPRVHLFGHIHQDGGAWQVGPTLFANVTTWEGCRGATVIELGERAVAVQVPPAGE
jgi:Icc-related predicted phosphoesterase